MGDETSAEEMLYALKSDVARNRKNLDELQFDIEEKRKQLIENEKKLYEQLPSREAIQEMENRTMKLRNMVADLSSKLDNDQDKEKNEMIAL
jgi:predicted  nucleic acid-binding Zn-ribbon protein